MTREERGKAFTRMTGAGLLAMATGGVAEAANNIVKAKAPQKLSPKLIRMARIGRKVRFGGGLLAAAGVGGAVAARTHVAKTQTPY